MMSLVETMREMEERLEQLTAEAEEGNRQATVPGSQAAEQVGILAEYKNKACPDNILWHFTVYFSNGMKCFYQRRTNNTKH